MALGCSGFGWLPALTASIAPADMCSRSASAIWDRALLPVHRNNTRGRRRELPSSWTRRRLRRETQRGVQRAAGALQRLAAGDEVDGVVAVAAVRRAAARGRPARLRGAGAGGTTPGSAARRSAPSTPARSDRSARAPATAATAAGATPAARTVAARRTTRACPDSNDRSRINQIRLMYRPAEQSVLVGVCERLGMIAELQRRERVVTPRSGGCWP